MSEVPTQNGGRRTTSTVVSPAFIFWLFVGVVLLMTIPSRLVEHFGFLGGLGVGFLLAAGTYIISFVFFLRKSKQSFRIPMPDSTRIFVSSILLIMVSMGLTDLGPFKAVGIAALCALGWYTISYVFFRRKVTESFRTPMDSGARYGFPFPVAIIVASALDLRLLEYFGAVWLLYVGIYIVSFLFFSKKDDSPQAETVVASASES